MRRRRRWRRWQRRTMWMVRLTRQIHYLVVLCVRVFFYVNFVISFSFLFFYYFFAINQLKSNRSSIVSSDSTRSFVNDLFIIKKRKKKDDIWIDFQCFLAFKLFGPISMNHNCVFFFVCCLANATFCTESQWSFERKRKEKKKKYFSFN